MPDLARTLQSPSELRDALAAIFPSLPRDFGASGESVFRDAGPTCRSLMRDFLYFFDRDIDRFTDRQLRRLAELVVRLTAAEGAPADAIGACFLEHARRVNIDRRFGPFLAAARRTVASVR